MQTTPQFPQAGWLGAKIKRLMPARTGKDAANRKDLKARLEALRAKYAKGKAT